MKDINKKISGIFGRKSSNNKLFIDTDNDPEGGETITSPCEGNVIPIESVNDPVFSGKVLGDGLAIEPSDGKIYSPADGMVETLMDTMHAVGIKTKSGAEVLIHIGKDTVSLNGKYFTAHVKEGSRIKKGQLLIEFDMRAVKEAGFDIITPVVITNSNEFRMEKNNIGKTDAGKKLFTLYPY